MEFRRDPAMGELRVVRKGTAARKQPQDALALKDSNAGVKLRVHVNLVEVNLNVLFPDTTPLRGLTREDFRVFEDGIEQRIAHFDASTEPAGIALVVDSSPSVFRVSEEMQQAALSFAAQLFPVDEVAVVAFSAPTYVLLPFSRDRALLGRAIEAIHSVRAAAASPASAIGSGSNIYQAVYLTVRELFRGRSGRKAVVLLTDGQDSGLGLSWDPSSAHPKAGETAGRLTFEDVCRTLTAAGVEMYVVSTENRPKAMTDQWLAKRQDETLITPAARAMGMIHYTLYLAELVRRAGGRIYFLREIGRLEQVYRQIAASLRAEYTLGYYTASGMVRPGWRSIRVEVKGHSDVHTTHRAAFYVPAEP